VAVTALNGKEWFRKHSNIFVCLAMDKLGNESNYKVYPRTGHEGPEGE